MATYCISDIHGDGKKYFKFKEMLKDDDKYYVIGDAIDRGNEGIEILLDIINDPRATMLMGNHEYMMLNYLHSRSGEDAILWCIYNGGNKTLAKYEELQEQEQQLIVDYLESLPLMLEVKVNQKSFVLTHSCFLEGKELPFYYKDAKKEEIINIVWDRVTPNNFKECIGSTLVSGHTYVQHYDTKEIVFDSEKIEEAKYIDIDGGCAIIKADNSLIALKLDDLTVNYIGKGHEHGI